MFESAQVKAKYKAAGGCGGGCALPLLLLLLFAFGEESVLFSVGVPMTGVYEGARVHAWNL